MNNKKIVDVAKANNLGRKLQLAVITILTLSYVVQIMKNEITPVNMAILMITMWVPVAGANLLYKKNPDSELIKHVIGVGYGIFYLAICAISDQQLVFTYAFPMVIVIAIYCDIKFAVTVASGTMLISTIHAVNCAIRGGFSNEAIAALEIQIAATALVGIYTIIANKFIVDFTSAQMKEINSSNEMTEKMLDSIVEVANTLADEVTIVSEKLVKLEESSEETLSSMKEVQSGADESAQAVENQLHKTEEISGQIESVTLASENIGTSVDSSINAISEGKNSIGILIKQAKASEEAAYGAVKEVEELKSSTDKMESIVELISSVASQTSLLALNASIEAARAGEAGRGFAVVATEISSLASQTQSATEDINNLISNIAAEMTEVASAITNLVDSNRLQNESAKTAAENFEKIVTNSDDIKKNSKQLSKIVDLLEKTNQEIVESIQTISAITEEVTAHSSTTYEITEGNREVVKDVKDIVEEMISNSDKLKAMSK